ncbi:MAG: MFS transporter [Deltaproteobacteria bacterium]|nr:MAG: MFS transporter [Deltaproteobacteria bacterium]
MRGKVDIRKSLQASFKDGVFASLMSGVTDYYVIPFALFLGATVQQVGWVSGIPSLLGSVSQLFAVRAVLWVGSRLRLLIRAVAAQATLLVVIGTVAWMNFSHPVEFFLAILVLFVVCGAVAGPAWGSLMTDYIPTRKRG